MYYLLEATFVLTVFNVGLLIALLYPSVRNYFKTRSLVTGMLMLFVILFLVQNLLAIYFHLANMPLYTREVDLELATLSLLETIGFGALLWVTYR